LAFVVTLALAFVVRTELLVWDLRPGKEQLAAGGTRSR